MDYGPIIAVAIFIGGLLAALPLVRASRTKATISLLTSELAVETGAREAQERRHQEKIAEMGRVHASEIGELRGQLAVVTASFAETIATKVIDALGAKGVLGD